MAFDSDRPNSERADHTAGLPPDVHRSDRYTASGWLDLLREQFREETWTAAIAAEALRLGVTTLHVHYRAPVSKVLDPPRVDSRMGRFR